MEPRVTVQLTLEQYDNLMRILIICVQNGARDAAAIMRLGGPNGARDAAAIMRLGGPYGEFAQRIAYDLLEDVSNAEDLVGVLVASDAG